MKLSKNFSTSNTGDLKDIRRLIVVNLLEPLQSGYHRTAQGQADIETHVDGRLNHFRNYYIPWINSILPLTEARILEVGSGTGASTLALAEQGAKVTGIDVDTKSMEIAKFRLQHTGHEAELLECNANAIEKRLGGKTFDAVIFFAALEHMTIEERLDALSQAFSVLKPGGHLFVLEAPNRLWLYDFHTAFLPYYLWLPDELAARYARYSKRDLYRNAVNKNTSGAELARWGRGVSYHEFELAGIPAGSMRSARGVREYHHRGRILQNALLKVSLNHKYKKLLMKMKPAHVAACFFDPFLDVCLRK